MAPVAALLGFRRHSADTRRPALVLVNGLAEQAETWLCNRRVWGRHFDVHTPNLVCYAGAALHRRIRDGLPVDVDYLVGRLHTYLDSFVQTPPYFLAGNSLGGKVVVEYAVRYPEQVSRLVLLGPSGLGDGERLPRVEGVRRSDLPAMVDSVFYDSRRVSCDVVRSYRDRFGDRRWRLGLLKTIRGTMGHSVRDLLPRVTQPTLLVAGEEDRIVDPRQAEAAAPLLPRGRFVRVPRCGHAPQLEKAKLVNRLVIDFLTRPDAP